MELTVSMVILKKLPQFKTDKKGFEERFEDVTRWKSDTDWFTTDIDNFSEAEIELILQEATGKDETKYKNIVNKIGLLRNVNQNPHGAIIKRLDQLCEAAKSVIGKLPNKWLFSEDNNGCAVAYYVRNIEHNPYDTRNQTSANVEIDMNYIKRGEMHQQCISFHQLDLLGKRNVIELLMEEGYYVETPELVAAYMKDVEKYKTEHTLTGHQFLARGKASLSNDRWDSGTIAMERDGQQTKVVMDDLYDEDTNSRREKATSISSLFWYKGPKKEDNNEENFVIPPLHPAVKVFDLIKHRYVVIHVKNIETYKYDASVEAKLVLPQNKKDLVDILVQGTKNVMEDIIKGKTGGIIVMATGEPGTGKTLTAEVYSETIQKPLYVVQCSQLGTNEEELEKELTTVLTRAVRWEAILLIDEADVYIHKRGNDIHQNAIVGVFLRVLEYYRGILFMTSNRATIIDDAIISRLTAHIRYELPEADDAIKIWGILADQFKIKLDGLALIGLTKRFPKVSGRTIKALLKLSKLIADKDKKPVTPTTIEYASQFLDGVNNDEEK